MYDLLFVLRCYGVKDPCQPPHSVIHCKDTQLNTAVNVGNIRHIRMIRYVAGPGDLLHSHAIMNVLVVHGRIISL